MNAVIPELHAPAQERVVYGAKELDRVKPGWFQQINIVKLDMMVDEECILGQLYGSFDRALVFLGWTLVDAARRGVYVRQEEELSFYDILGDCWAAEILTRKLTA